MGTKRLGKHPACRQTRTDQMGFHRIVGLDAVVRRARAQPALSSVQPTQLQLSSTATRDAKILKERVEKTLRDSLMHLRKKAGLRTTMNFQGNSILKKLLPGLELRRGGLADDLPSQDGTDLDRISKSHKIC